MLVPDREDLPVALRLNVRGIRAAGRRRPLALGSEPRLAPPLVQGEATDPQLLAGRSHALAGGELQGVGALRRRVDPGDLLRFRLAFAQRGGQLLGAAVLIGLRGGRPGPDLASFGGLLRLVPPREDRATRNPQSAGRLAGALRGCERQGVSLLLVGVLRCHTLSSSATAGPGVSGGSTPLADGQCVTRAASPPARPLRRTPGRRPRLPARGGPRASGGARSPRRSLA
jgi:hypothetical protein